MLVNRNLKYRTTFHIAVVSWNDPDENAIALCDELIALGHQTQIFLFDKPIPDNVDIVFTFAPYGRFLQIPHQIRNMPASKRPLLVHWNFESIPNINIPWPLLRSLGALRTKVDRINDEDSKWAKKVSESTPFSLVNRKMHKLRYLGDYHYAYKDGSLNLLIDSSKIFSDMFSSHGMPTTYAPWGISPSWYDDLNLERDIDVLWMGKWRTKERAKLLHEIREELSKHGLKMYLADNVENPFIYGDMRTHFLNRAKITLNILPTWYDPGFQFRFTKAAANKSLVVTDPVLPHVPHLEEDKHYVSAQIDSLVDAILYYIEHEDERDQIVANAYRLVTHDFTMVRSVKRIMDSVVDLV